MHDKTHFTADLVYGQWNQTATSGHIQTKDPAEREVPPSVIVYVHPKVWMDTDGMLVWLHKAWGQRPGSELINTKSLTVWDQFRAHLNDKVKHRNTRSTNTDIAVIPGRLTSILQLLDMSINHPFKCKLHELWSVWMSSGCFKCTAAGNLK